MEFVNFFPMIAQTLQHSCKLTWLCLMSFLTLHLRNQPSLCKSQWTIPQMALHLFCMPPVPISQSSHNFMNSLYNLLKYICKFKILIFNSRCLEELVILYRYIATSLDPEFTAPLITSPHSNHRWLLSVSL